MDKKRIRYWSGLVLSLLSLVLLIWTMRPIEPATREIIFQPGELKVLTSSNSGSGQDISVGNAENALVFMDERVVNLVWSPVVRKGDTSQIQLRFSGNDLSQAKILTERGAGSGVQNLFDFYNVDAEARVELSGVDVTPEGISGQVLQEGRDVLFSWKISPDEEGTYEGISWLYLRFYPLEGGDFIEQAISAQSFNIKVVSFLGLNTNYWRVIGFLGIFIGIYIQKTRIFGIILGLFQVISKKNIQKDE